MTAIPLEEFKEHMTELSWLLLDLIREHPMLSKKELMELNTDIKKHRFEQVYLKLLSTLLIEEVPSEQDQRSVQVRITKYGQQLIDIKGAN